MRRRSIRLLAVLAALFAALFLLPPPDSSADSIRGKTAREILDQVDDLYRGRSSSGEMSMTIVTAHWTRTLDMEFWSLGKDRSLIRILSPKKEKGTATLRSGNEIWNYLPKVDRVIKLPSSMMASSWMGSHFTNDDLVKESRMAEGYDISISFEGVAEGEEVIELTCTPKEGAAIVWGKVVCLVRAEDTMPLRFDYYDEEMQPARVLTFYDFREMGGRLLPATMKIVPSDKTDESTVVTYNQIAFELSLDDDFFSIRTLRR